MYLHIYVYLGGCNSHYLDYLNYLKNSTRRYWFLVSLVYVKAISMNSAKLTLASLWYANYKNRVEYPVATMNFPRKEKFIGCKVLIPHYYMFAAVISDQKTEKILTIVTDGDGDDGWLGCLWLHWPQAGSTYFICFTLNWKLRSLEAQKFNTTPQYRLRVNKGSSYHYTYICGLLEAQWALKYLWVRLFVHALVWQLQNMRMDRSQELVSCLLYTREFDYASLVLDYTHYSFYH